MIENPLDREKVLVKLTQFKAARVFQATDNLGMGKLGQPITEVLENDLSFGLSCFYGLNLAVGAYNDVRITPKNAELLRASANLITKIPELPAPSEIFRSIDLYRENSRWSPYFIRALGNLEEKISKGKLIWYKTRTNKEALAAGGVVHEFEEKVLLAVDPKGEQKIEIDEVTDVIMEMLMWKYPGATRLGSWLCNEPSLDPDGGLGWAKNYDHISDKLRHQAGFP